jgi:hypothetical protein
LAHFLRIRPTSPASAALFRTLCVTLWLLSSVHLGYGQDLAAIGKAKPLKVTGGLTTNHIAYGASSNAGRRDPYSFFFSGNVNFDLYGWSVPLSFTYSNQQSSFQQPFNQYGIRPTYKWATGYLGYNSLTFSPYTLNGHIFYGAGVELAPPGIFKLTALYGRFQQSVPADTLSGAENIPAFRRMGYGLKMGVQKDRDFVDLILFRARDQVRSLPYVPDTMEVLPEENLVLSLNAGKALFSKLLLTAEFATSAMARDLRSEKDSMSKPGLFRYTGRLYTPNNSSAYYNAFKSGLTYNGGSFTAGLGYERIDPEYRTLGAYYFNNDVENITVNATTQLFAGKVSLAANVGSQRNNLQNQNASNLRRLVGSINAGIVPSEALNVNVTYSNFQSFTRIRSQFERINQLTPYDFLDTLDYVQVSQTANANVSYQLGKGESAQVLNGSLSYNQSDDRQGAQNTFSYFYNASTGYSRTFKPLQLQVTASLNGSWSKMSGVASWQAGPTLAASRDFLAKKLRSTAAFSFNQSYTGSQPGGRILNARLTGSYRLAKKHNFNLSTVWLSRRTKVPVANGFHEVTANLGYAYQF